MIILPSGGYSLVHYQSTHSSLLFGVSKPDVKISLSLPLALWMLYVYPYAL